MNAAASSVECGRLHNFYPGIKTVGSPFIGECRAVDVIKTIFGANLEAGSLLMLESVVKNSTVSVRKNELLVFLPSM